MAAKEINVGSGPNLFPNYPTEQRDADGNWTKVYRYWQKDDQVGHNLPAHNATIDQDGNAVTDRDGNTLKLRQTDISQGGAPGITNVELTYARSETSLVLKGPVDNPRSVRLIREDIPIDDERLLQANGGTFTQAQIDAAKKAGYQSLPLYGVEYTYTELDASFAWTEAAVIASVQATGAPTGMGSATAAKWELTGREIDETEEETIIRTHYRFAAAGVVPLKP